MKNPYISRIFPHLTGKIPSAGAEGMQGSELLVHKGGVLLALHFCDGEDLQGHGAGAEANFQLVADLHVVGGFHHPAVGGDTLVVAGLVGHGAALDEAGDLEIFVQPHLTC